MLFYVFKSRKIITDFKILDHINYSFFPEKDFLYERSYLPFTLAILHEYLKFILNKLPFFNNKQQSFNNRSEYYTNLYFKHILIIEWGKYDLNDLYSRSKSFNSFSDSFLPDLHNPLSYRGDSAFEYVVSRYDLVSPFHKTSSKRYLFDTILPKRPPSIGQKYFFNFYILMPTDVTGPTLNTNKFNVFKEFYKIPPPPISVNYPILFELFLLKFNFLSFLFSSHPINIYYFFNGFFFESIFIRFKNITFLIFNFYLSRFWIHQKYKPNDVLLFSLLFEYYFLRVFYSINTITFFNMHSVFYYNSIKKTYREKTLLKFFPLISSFFSFFGLTFFLIICLTYFDLSYIFYFKNIFFEYFSYFLITLWQNIFLFYFFLSILFFKFIRFLSVLKSYTLRLNLLNLYNRVYLILAKLSFGFGEVFLVFFTNFFIFLFFYFFFSSTFLSINLNYFLFCNFFLLLLNIFDRILLLLESFVFFRLEKRKYVHTYVFLTPLGFFFFLIYSVCLFPFLIFIFSFFIIFFIFLKSYMPDVHDLDYTDKDDQKKLLKVPFFSTYDGFSYSNETFDVFFSESERKIKYKPFSDKQLFQITIYPYDDFKETYFFKFLINRKNKLFEIQYNNLNYNDFKKNNRGYTSRSVYFLPHYTIYFLMLINYFLFFSVINFKFIFYCLLFEFSTIKGINNDEKYFSSLYVGDNYILNHLTNYLKSSSSFTYNDIFFNARSLNRTTFNSFLIRIPE